MPMAIGTCVTCRFPFPAAGNLRIDALVTDFEKITMEDDFRRPPRADGSLSSFVHLPVYVPLVP